MGETELRDGDVSKLDSAAAVVSGDSETADALDCVMAVRSVSFVLVLIVSIGVTNVSADVASCDERVSEVDIATLLIRVSSSPEVIVPADSEVEVSNDSGEALVPFVGDPPVCSVKLTVLPALADREVAISDGAAEILVSVKTVSCVRVISVSELPVAAVCEVRISADSDLPPVIVVTNSSVCCVSLTVVTDCEVIVSGEAGLSVIIEGIVPFVSLASV